MSHVGEMVFLIYDSKPEHFKSIYCYYYIIQNEIVYLKLLCTYYLHIFHCNNINYKFLELNVYVSISSLPWFILYRLNQDIPNISSAYIFFLIAVIWKND